MKFVVLLAVLAVALARPGDSLFDAKYDSFDVKELVGNLRLLKAYVLCFQSKGKCTPEGSDFKKLIPETIETNCANCSEKQKTLIAEVLQAIIEKLPEDWKELDKIYNSKGQSFEFVQKFINEYAPK